MKPGAPLKRTPFAVPLNEDGSPRWSTLGRNAELGRTSALRSARLVLAEGPGAGAVKGKSAARTGGGSGRAESFPPGVAALIDARDPWCVHCGSPSDLHRHHRRGKGQGGDPREHTHCACNGVRLCSRCHLEAHTTERREAEAEGLIIPRSTLEPWTVGVLVHTADGGMTKYPSCTGQWLDEVPGRDVA